MKFLAAAIQMLASSDKEANLKEAEANVRQAVAKGANMLVVGRPILRASNRVDAVKSLLKELS